MTFRDFLDASYALLCEEHLRIQPLQDLAAVAGMIQPSDLQMEKVPKRAEVKAQNESSMAALQSMLANVPNSPTRRKPRRA